MPKGKEGGRNEEGGLEEARKLRGGRTRVGFSRDRKSRVFVKTGEKTEGDKQLFLGG